MSASESAVVDAVAFQLAVALEEYDRDVAAMIAGWPDLQRYRAVSEQMGHIRMYSSALPEAGVQWVELLISHAELVHVLWRAHYEGVPSDDRDRLDEVRERNIASVSALRSRCLRVIGCPGRPLGKREHAGS
jgi:hypothetical protein